MGKLLNGGFHKFECQKKKRPVPVYQFVRKTFAIVVSNRSGSPSKCSEQVVMGTLASVSVVRRCMEISHGQVKNRVSPDN